MTQRTAPHLAAYAATHELGATFNPFKPCSWFSCKPYRQTTGITATNEPEVSEKGRLMMAKNT